MSSANPSLPELDAHERHADEIRSFATPTRFAEHLFSDELTIVGELQPPTGFDLGSWTHDAKALSGLVHCIQLTDMPLAQVHVDSLAAAARLRQLGFDVMLTTTGRDRNLIAQQARFLAAAAMGACAVFIVRGDLPRCGDHPSAMGVYEHSSAEWIQIAKTLAVHGTLHSGRAVAMDGDVPPYLVGAAIAPGSPDRSQVVADLAAKHAAGADFFMTQPVFDAAAFCAFLNDVGPSVRPPILAGIAAPRSHAEALRLDSFPGISVPNALISQLATASPDEGRALAIAWAISLARELEDDGRVAGLLLYPIADDASWIGELAQRLHDARGGDRSGRLADDVTSLP